MVSCSRPSETSPCSAKPLSRRLTISRTLPSSSASCWWVTLSTRLVAGQQQPGQTLVEAGEGDFLDQLHQFADALGKQVKDEIAKRRVFEHQFPE